MGAYLWLHRPTFAGRNDRLRRELGHMAVDAVLSDPVALLRKETTTLDFVARQTTAREGRRIPLREMNIVARGAGHVGGLKTAAPLQ
jgi:hypothetical protein